MSYDLGKLQEAARKSVRGDIIMLMGNKVAIKQFDPTWPLKPYVLTCIGMQEDEYTFHNSMYDLTLEDLKEEVRMTL